MTIIQHNTENRWKKRNERKVNILACIGEYMSDMHLDTDVECGRACSTHYVKEPESNTL